VFLRSLGAIRTNLSALSALTALSVLSSSCKPRAPSPEELKATLVAHPEILFEVIKAHPAEFFQVVQRAGAEVQRSADAAARQDSLRREEDLANPRRPAMGLGRATIGPAAAPIVIVEYSDFQCPYCHRSVGVLRALIGHYGDRLRLVLKEAPLEMHPQAMPAAQRRDRPRTMAPRGPTPRQGRRPSPLPEPSRSPGPEPRRRAPG